MDNNLALRQWSGRINDHGPNQQPSHRCDDRRPHRRVPLLIGPAQPPSAPEMPWARSPTQ
jgi:hypothetical protein